MTLATEGSTRQEALRGFFQDLLVFFVEQLQELVSFLIVFVLRLLMSLYDLAFHREVHRRPRPADVKAFLQQPLTDQDYEPYSTAQLHEIIHEQTTGWFREEIYHIRLETGKTVLGRRRATRHANKTRGALLLVHGFAQNRFAWHLPGRSLVNFLAEAGYDVFFLSLRGSVESLKLGGPMPVGFHEYVEIDIYQALRVITKVSQHKKVVLVGHSMGGALSCAAASVHPRYVEGVVHVAGLYGFRHHRAPIWNMFFTFTTLLQKFFPRTPKDLVLPTKEIGKLLKHLVRWSSIFHLLSPISPYLKNSTEAHILKEYLELSFEASTLGILQGITNMASGMPFCDQQGNDYLQMFEALPLPLLVICAARDDLVNINDSLLCYTNSNSTDKEKIVFASDNDHEKRSQQLAFGHCDILIGHLAANHVWEKLRIWLDERKKLQVSRSSSQTSPDRLSLPEQQHQQRLEKPGMGRRSHSVPSSLVTLGM